MKKINLNTFVYRLADELKDFEESWLSFDVETEKTANQWINSFLSYCGYQESGDSFISEEYDDELDYMHDSYYEDLVNRRKYRSFRDDDMY